MILSRFLTQQALLFLILLSCNHWAVSRDCPSSIIEPVTSTLEFVDVNLSTVNFTNITALNLKLAYDKNIAIASGVKLGPSMRGFFDINITVPGEIRIGWYNAVPSSLPDSSVTFTINFIKVTNGNLSIRYIDDGFSCTYSDENFNALNDLPYDHFYINGAVILKSTGALPSPAGEITGQSVVCSGSIEVYICSSIENALTYQWVLPQSATIVSRSDSNAIVVKFNDATNDIITVSGLNQNGVGQASKPLPVMIIDAPSITSHPVSATLTIPGQSAVSFSIDASGSDLSYRWQQSEHGDQWADLTDGNMYSGTTSFSLTITNPPLLMNSYRFRCLVNGTCSTQPIISDEVLLTVNTVTSTNTWQYNPSCLFAYPNPFNQFVNLFLDSPVNAKVTVNIIDIMGIIHLSNQLQAVIGANTIQLYTSHLPTGNYFIELKSNFGTNTRYNATTMLIYKSN